MTIKAQSVSIVRALAHIVGLLICYFTGACDGWAGDGGDGGDGNNIVSVKICNLLNLS